jgi:hypothetical protein
MPFWESAQDSALSQLAFPQRHRNFRVAVRGADELKRLFPQEKAALLDLRCRTLTLEPL